MKKLFLKCILIASILFIGFSFISVSSECNYDPNEDTISESLDNCFEVGTNTLVTISEDGVSGDLNISGGFKTKIQSWVQTFSGILAILAVGSIVYGSLLLVLSRGEEEKLKKGKDVIKWSILGFLALIFATALITLVVNIMFSIS